VALHRVGQTPVKTGADGGLVAAELRNDRLLTLLNDEKTSTKKPVPSQINTATAAIRPTPIPALFMSG